MEVLILTNTLVGGGAEKQLLLSAAGLARGRIRCVVFVLRPVETDARYAELIKNCRCEGVEFYIPRFRFDVVKVVVRLAVEMLLRPRCVLWTWGFRSECIRLLFPLLWIASGVVALRSASCEEMQRHALLLTLGQPLTDLYIANSRRAIKLLHEYVPATKCRSSVIYNSVERVNNLYRANCGMVTRPRIVMLGNVRYYVKGYDIALRMAEILKSRGFDFQIVIGGRQISGETSLARAINAKGIDDVVQWIGPVVDVHRFLRSGDIFMMLSRYEGTSNALLEAMANGLPCVSTAVGDIEWFVERGAGISIVTIGDAYSAADAVEKLCNNRDLANDHGRKNVFFCEKYFAETRMIEATINALLLCSDKAATQQI